MSYRWQAEGETHGYNVDDDRCFCRQARSWKSGSGEPFQHWRSLSKKTRRELKQSLFEG